jgi:hypothetical protein
MYCTVSFFPAALNPFYSAAFSFASQAVLGLILSHLPKRLLCKVYGKINLFFPNFNLAWRRKEGKIFLSLDANGPVCRRFKINVAEISSSTHRQIVNFRIYSIFSAGRDKKKRHFVSAKVWWAGCHSFFVYFLYLVYTFHHNHT